MKVSFLSLVLSCFLLAFAVNVAARESMPATKDSAVQKGMGIAKRAEARDSGFGSYSAKAKMELKNKKGKVTTTRTFDFKFKEVPGDADKALTAFLSPANVKGTVLLTHGHKSRDDDQWIYLPALKRDKRILSSGQTGSFLGSEFSFEDMRSPVIEKYTYRFIRTEKIRGFDCFVVERIPLDKKSGYKKQLVWLDKAELRLHKIEFFDRRMKHSKTFEAKGYKAYKSKYWRPMSISMSNLKNGRSTLITYSGYNFKLELSDTDFHKSVLKRP